MKFSHFVVELEYFLIDIVFVPRQILKVLRTSMDKGTEAGYADECLGFGELAMTKESRGLIGLFHGQTECKKNRFGKPERETK